MLDIAQRQAHDAFSGKRRCTRQNAKEGSMKRPLGITLVAITAVLAVVGTVLATHPSSGQTTLILTRSTLSEKVNYNLGDVRIHTKAPQDIVVAQVTFVPGGSSGWHSHPGPVFVAVKTGTLTVYHEDCTSATYGPNTAFFEAGTEHSLLVRNQGTEDAVVYATFIVPPETAPTGLRIPAPDRCGLL
jgi:quercetin dioxygenase-like cupin family protein